MKKILTAAVLMGLSATALLAEAEIDLSSLPADVQAKIKAAAADPAVQSLQQQLQSYTDKESKIYNATTTWLAQLPAYVSKIPGAQPYVNIIETAVQNTGAPLGGLEVGAPKINSITLNLATVDSVSNLISEQYVYPNACVNTSREASQKGCVTTVLGNNRQYAVYPLPSQPGEICNNQVKALGVVSPEVITGKIGTDQDFLIAGNLLNKTINIVTLPIGPNSQPVVVCADND